MRYGIFSLKSGQTCLLIEGGEKRRGKSENGERRAYGEGRDWGSFTGDWGSDSGRAEGCLTQSNSKNWEREGGAVGFEGRGTFGGGTTRMMSATAARRGSRGTGELDEVREREGVVTSWRRSDDPRGSRTNAVEGAGDETRAII